MRLILSRKGFDSAAGGCPNPILPDGTLVPLPIPDPSSPVRYQDIRQGEQRLDRLVTQLTRGKVKGTDGAHLDPDLVAPDYPRKTGWRPVLGQSGAAQGHLQKMEVGAGDLFLFFGVFREVRQIKPAKPGAKRRWQFIPGAPKQHLIWGWMQIDRIIGALSEEARSLSWLDYHPHRHRCSDSNNRLYLSSEELILEGEKTGLPGAGTFASVQQATRLTATDAALCQWQLPRWFFPAGRPPLSYHHRESRWQQYSDHTILQAVARGQEFVLNGQHYPEASDWARALIEKAIPSEQTSQELS